MKTGFSRLDITPPLGIALGGYFEERRAVGILDPLQVNTVAFCDGERKMFLISLDLLMVKDKIGEIYRKNIAEALNVPIESIFFSCTHTHTGPKLGAAFYDDEGMMQLYDDFLGSQMLDSCRLALQDLKETTFSVGCGKAEKIAFLRRYRMKDGSVQTNPGVGNTNIDHPLGEIDESVQLLRMHRNGDKDIFIVNFGVHADVIGGDFISADFPCFVRSTVENALGNVHCIYFNGAEGDINHINPLPDIKDRRGLSYDSFDSVPRGYEHSKHMGRAIAGAVLQICDKTADVASGSIFYNQKQIYVPTHQENKRLEEAKNIISLYEQGRGAELPFQEMELTTAVAEADRILRLKDGPESIGILISVIGFGDIAFVGVTGEPFSKVGIEIKKASPFSATFVCSLTNGGSYYYPSANAYEEGGYEAKASPFASGVAEKIIEESINAMKKI